MITVKDFSEIRQFKLGRDYFGKGFYFTCAYLLDGVMIDTGCAHTADELVKALGGIPVNKIIITHSHEDHIGANAQLQKIYGSDVYVHPVGLPVLAEPRKMLLLKPYQKVMWGWPEPSRGKPLDGYIETEKYKLKVIHTPGHSPDHVCFLEENNGWLFTGDAFVGGRDRALRVDYDIWGVIKSLKKLAAHNPEVMFTCSGSVRKNAGRDIQEKINILEEAGEQVLELWNQGLNHKKIKDKLFGSDGLIRFITLGHFSGKNLVRSFIEDKPDNMEE